MASQTSNKDTSYDIANKRYCADNEGTEGKPLNFYDADRYAFITIDPVIVGKLKLTREDLFIQKIVGEDILLRRRKETRNRSSRPHLSQEADNQDYEA